jgi:signal transduction histidine kinase
LTAEISHELRTPLAAISAEAELALRKPRQNVDYRDAIRSIQRRATQLGEVLEALLLAARGDAGSETATDANVIARRAIDQLAGNGYGVHFVLRPAPDQPVVAVGATTGAQILSPLIENAGRYGRETAEVRVASRGEDVTFSISDDGPGIQEQEVAHVFEPGRRGSAADGESQGAGLGLALSRRLARAVGGDVVVVPGDLGGIVNVTLPSAHRN